MDSHQNPHRLKSRVAIPRTITRIVLTVIFSVVIVIALVFLRLRRHTRKPAYRH